MRNKITLILTLVLAVSILAACGQPGSPKQQFSEPTSLTINTPNHSGIIDVHVGATTTLTATIKGEGASRAVTWTVSNPEHARITPDGRLTGLKPNSVPIIITAASKTHPDINDTAHVYVKPAPDTISITKIRITASGMSSCCQTNAPPVLGTGKTAQFRTIITTNNGHASPNTTTTWASSNPSALTINANGTATAHKPGKTTITATITTPNQPNGITGTYNLEVTPVFTGRVTGHDPRKENQLQFAISAHPASDGDPYLNVSTVPLDSQGRFELVMPSVPDLACSGRPAECFAYGMNFWAVSSDPRNDEYRNLLAAPRSGELLFGWVYAFADVIIVDNKWPIPVEVSGKTTIPINANLKAGWNPIAVKGNILSQSVTNAQQPATLTLQTNTW